MQSRTRGCSTMPVYRVAAGASNDRPQDVSGSPARLDMLQLLPSDVMRPRTGLPRNFGDAVTANVQQCGAPPCKPAKIGICSCLSQRFHGVHTASRLSVRCPSRSTERGCLRWLRRRSFRRASCIRGHRIADLRRAVADGRHSLPRDVRAVSGSRLEHDPAVSTGEHSALGDSTTACTMRSTASTPAVRTSR